MAYPGTFLRLQMSGATYGPEIWSCGLNIQSFGDPDAQPEDLDPWLNACGAWMQRSTSGISSLAFLRLVKVNLVGADGRYLDDSETRYAETNIPGGVPGAAAWPQLSAALTLKTDAQRGLASKGRIYPPLTGAVAVDGQTGQIAQSAAQGMATSLTTLINTINGLGFGEVVVASKGGQTGNGVFRKVTSVVCGSVMDTQRRRRNALPEFYYEASAPVVAGP
jgi:hypothetical protein